MNENDVSDGLAKNRLDEAQVEEVGGGLCSADELVRLTQSFKSAYENLVDFTSHVIDRVSGGSGTI